MKKSVIIISALVIASAATIALTAKNTSILTFGEECEHVGNHYLAKEATVENSGIREYWVCCNCHEHFFEEPENGTWTEMGEADVVIDEYDDRYVENKSFLWDMIYDSTKASYVKDNAICVDDLSKTRTDFIQYSIQNSGAYELTFSGSFYYKLSFAQYVKINTNSAAMVTIAQYDSSVSSKKTFTVEVPENCCQLTIEISGQNAEMELPLK